MYAVERRFRFSRGRAPTDLFYCQVKSSFSLCFTLQFWLSLTERGHNSRGEWVRNRIIWPSLLYILLWFHSAHCILSMLSFCWVPIMYKFGTIGKTKVSAFQRCAATYVCSQVFLLPENLVARSNSKNVRVIFYRNNFVIIFSRDGQL